jgi:nucleoside-diphosphate-sugar epimerase
MTVSILGCGWFGRALAGALIAKGITVKGSTTSQEKLDELSALDIKPYLINLSDEGKNDTGFFDCDVLIVSIPPKFRKGESSAFIPKIEHLIKLIKQHQINHVIYTSSTGVYGDHQCIVNELDEAKPENEPGQLLRKAEQLFKTQTNFKPTIIRFAGLVGPGRHPGRFFAGKTNVPNGLSAVNMVHLDDAVGITIAVIEKAARGQLFNACAPSHPTRAEFYTRFTNQLELPLPEFADGSAILKQIESVNVQAQLAYRFKYDDWLSAVLS